MTITLKSNPDGVSGAIQVNGNDAIAFGTQGITQGAPFSFRNKIINGDMRIDQRNAGASVTIPAATVTYTADRFWAYGDQASKFSVQQNAGAAAPPAGFTKYLGVTSLSAYSVAAGERFLLSQSIEGLNVADLGWGTAAAQTVTLSFRVYSSLTGTFGGSLRNSASTRSYPFSYTIGAANTWTAVNITIPGDTTGTWLTDSGVGVYVFWGLGVGSTFSGTAGSWSGSNFVSSTGATSVVGTSGATFYITGVQLEAGSVATPFERRPYGTELALCQRYYWKESNILATANPPASNTYYTDIYSPVEMRSAPSVVLSNFGNSNSGSASVNAAYTRRIRVQATSSGAGTAYSTFTLEAPAEL